MNAAMAAAFAPNASGATITKNTTLHTDPRNTTISTALRGDLFMGRRHLRIERASPTHSVLINSWMTAHCPPPWNWGAGSLVSVYSLRLRDAARMQQGAAGTRL